MSDPTITAFLTKVLCSHGGRLPRDQLLLFLKLPNENIEQILKDNSQKFPVVGNLVLAQSPVRICPKYLKHEQEENCSKLHLCKEYLQGKCKRPHCKFHHNISSHYNQKVLKGNGISGLNMEELKVLLLQNDEQLQPEMSEVSIRNYRMLCQVKRTERLQSFHDAVKMENSAGIRDGRESRKRRNPGAAPQSKLPRTREGSAGMAAGPASFQLKPITTPVTTARPVHSSPVNVPMIGPSVSPAKPVPFPLQLVDRPNVQRLALTRPRRLECSLLPSVLLEEPVTTSMTSPLTLQPFVTIMKPNTPPAVSPVTAPPFYARLPNSPTKGSAVPQEKPMTTPITSPSKPQPSDLSSSIPRLWVSQQKRPTTPVTITGPANPPPVNGPSASQTKPVTVPAPVVNKSNAPPVVYTVTRQRRLLDSLYQGPSVPLKKQMTSCISSPSIHQSGVTSMKPSAPPGSSPSIAPSSCTRVNNSPTKCPSVLLENPVQSSVRSQKPATPVYTVPVFSPSKPNRVPVICLSNLWKYCNLGIRCPDMHYYLPYRWQIFKGTDWEDVPNMEEVEKCYCDPKVDRVHLIDFLTMRSGGLRVRHLSTVSSVVKPSEYVLTTEWLWYWRDEHDTWTQYGHSGVNHVIVTVSSSALENLYIADANAVIPFSIGNNSYEINFRDMKQKNVVYKTERDVRRRPKYLSFDDVKFLKGSTRSTAAKSKLKKSKRKLRKFRLELGTSPVKLEMSPLKTDIYPKTWDPESMPEVGCKKVLVSETSTEFSEIVSSFSKTVRGHEVKKMWRLQNPSLWQVFQWQKEQMKKVNPGQDVKEIQLFHGTERTHIDDICDQNFDWRICGTHGTVYGQGSYFARDASYSHNYSTPISGGSRAMFIARVLVGDYVTGNSQMKRPPLRPGSTSRYYDSCVDDTTNPSIYVVFEKLQIYPEYLLEYQEEQKKY